MNMIAAVKDTGGLRGDSSFAPFADFSPIFPLSQKSLNPSFQAHSPVKTVFRRNAKNAPKSQNTPSTNPYQNETQFPLSSLKNADFGNPKANFAGNEV